MRLVHHGIKLVIITALLASLGSLLSSSAGAASLWSTETTVPFAREAMAVVQVGNTIYTIGGYNDDGVSITDGYREIVEAYDLTTGVWTCSTDDPATTGCASKTLAPTPSRRWHTGVAAGNGKIYLVGGDDYYVGDVSTFEIYDIASNSWSTGPAMQQARDFPAAAVGYDGKLYVFGGVGLPRESLEIYDPNTDTWSDGADLPSGRGSAAAVTDPTGHKIYLLGGYLTGAAGDGITVFIYDIDTDSWSTGTPMNSERTQLGATFVGNHLYAIGGFYSDSTEPSAEVYDPVQDVWTPVAEQMPGDDFRVSAFTGPDGNIYAVTTSSRTLDTIYKLDTSDQTAPETNASAKNADNTIYTFGDWTGQTVTITLAATDSGAGVARTSYTIDGGDTKTYSAPFTVSGSGNHTINYWSTDAIGNLESAKSAIVKIDATAPTTTVSAKTADTFSYSSDDWTNQNVTVTLSASDAESGVDHISYTVDNGGTQTYSSPIAFSTEGYYQLTYWGVDKVGNDETHHTFIIKIDKTAPTATPSSENGSGQTIRPNTSAWFNQAVTVVLTCNDPLLVDSAAGSGIASCPSRTFDTEGTGQKGSFTTTDNAGNSYTIHITNIKIDLTDPTVSCDPADGAWHGDDVSISCSASDALSGLKKSDDAGFTLSTAVLSNTETNNAYTGTHQVCDAADRCVTAGPVTGNKVDKKGPTITSSASSNGELYAAGDWTNHDVIVTFECSDGGSGVATCGDPVTIAAEGGNQAASGSATDNVGNSASTSFTGVNIDKTAPVTSAGASTTSGPYSWVSWTNQTVTVTLSAGDQGGSNVSTISYAIDGKNPLTYDAPFDVSTDGQHTITFWSTDGAGNIEVSQSQQIWIDKTPPVITYSGNQSSYAITDHITISCNAGDTLSGVASTTCQDIDEPAYQFSTGTHTISASAIDLAGNVGQGSVTFTIGISADDLCTLTGEMVNNQRLANQLCAPLRLVEWAEAMHNQRMKTSALNSYTLLVTAQSGRSLTADEVRLLVELAGEL